MYSHGYLSPYKREEQQYFIRPMNAHIVGFDNFETRQLEKLNFKKAKKMNKMSVQ